MKSKEELMMLKDEYEVLKKKLCELSDEELNEVTGGVECVLPVLFGQEIEYRKENDIEWNSKVPTEPGSYKLSVDIDMDEKYTKK